MVKQKDKQKKLLRKNLNKKINFCIGRIFSFTDKNQKGPMLYQR